MALVHCSSYHRLLARPAVRSFWANGVIISMHLCTPCAQSRNKILCGARLALDASAVEVVPLPGATLDSIIDAGGEVSVKFLRTRMDEGARRYRAKVKRSKQRRRLIHEDLHSRCRLALGRGTPDSRSEQPLL